MKSRTKRRIETNPTRAIEKAIRHFTLTSPSNRLESFGDAPIFDQPLVGFADGDDPLFSEYKKVVHELHLTPREALTRHLAETLKLESPPLSSLSVIAFVMPFTRETRLSNAREKEGPSLRWNHTRWKGQEFINELSRFVVALLEGMGACALAPELSPFYEISQTPGGSASNWSQRHVAYSAGLGTFALNDGFITRKGQAMRCGSVVTSLKLKPSGRRYTDHLANCLFHANGTCGVCIRRCPGGAISEKGHDRVKCREVLFEVQRPWLEGAHGQGYIGRYAGCGLCQTGVPCESRIPARWTSRQEVPEKDDPRES